MNSTHLIGRWFGLDNVDAIEDLKLTFGAPWAQQGPAWVLFGCLLLIIAAVVFYVKYQPRAKRRVRAALAIARALLLCLIFLILADPVISVKLTNRPRPLLWLLFDGTDSMAIEDELSDAERESLGKAAGIIEKDPSVTAAKRHSRQSYIQSFVNKTDDNLLKKLNEKYRIKTFRFDRADGAQTLDTVQSGTETLDTEKLSEQLTTDGQVTALGKTLEDLALRHSSGNLSGVLIFSDFNQNAGPAPQMAAKRLGVPLYTVGIGPEKAVDIALSLQAPQLMKRAERSTLTAYVRQTGLKGQSVTVRLTARRLGGANIVADEIGIPIGEKTITLEDQELPVEFPFDPTESGRYLFTATIDPLPTEIVVHNNKAERESNIRDDFLRLMFVEYEPTWEWRFIKEVFHRDKLVGMRGFRTYLRSADPKVRETNELFLPTLTPKRSDFFANDVIFLSDMPAATLSSRFCEMTKEYVEKFGGGLVIIAGPRFGPGQLAETALADILPVTVDPDGRLNDSKEFRLRLTADGLVEDFMKLGNNPADSGENARAWDNLGKIPWYQPVIKVHSRAKVLAEHPTDKTIDQKTPQPIIAVRTFANGGHVVYVAFNETWRLRRKHGEQFYRQFWGQMINRMGLSHALGSQKRFVIKNVQPQYQADEKVTLTVEAYDANFDPLKEDNFPEKKLKAELFRPSRLTEGGDAAQAISIPLRRDGIFETEIPVFDSGEYRVRVTDPVTKEASEVFFQVASVSAERRSAVRNLELQQKLASETNGKSYTLETVNEFVNDFQPPEKIEVSMQTIEIWHTWFCFGLIVTLMFAEWLLRKWCNLA
ncbi:MAG: hypothetical protein JWM11_499 [Planctomycetaceae bacterium]|nr:hypothetical protein [Planctomycetaceae bacterium]